MTFSFQGIASRREYAYTLIVVLAIETLAAAFFGWTAPRLVGANILNTNALVLGTIFAYAINIVAIAAQFSVTVRRLRGLGLSLFLVLLLIIPGINLLLALALIFGEESTENAQFERAMKNGKDVIDQKTIDEELRRQAEEAVRGEKVVDAEAKDVKGGDNK